MKQTLLILILAIVSSCHNPQVPAKTKDGTLTMVELAKSAYCDNVKVGDTVPINGNNVVYDRYRYPQVTFKDSVILLESKQLRKND